MFVSRLLAVFFSFSLGFTVLEIDGVLADDGNALNPNSDLAADLSRTVRFATLRNKTGETAPPRVFGDGRNTLHAGYCDITRTPIKTLQSLSESVPIHIPEDILEIAAIRQTGFDHILEDLLNTNGSTSPVVYTHGYYIDFERGCKRASILQQALNLEHRLLHFSWPSDGAILNYAQDEADIYWSVAPLTAMLEDMIHVFGVNNIDLVAHSLGARGNFYALLNLAMTHHSDLPLINNVVFVAPDIDAEIFSQHLGSISKIANMITVYVSENDHPLSLSRQIHGYPRLGQTGAHLENMPGIEIIDVSTLSVRKLSGHLYHLYHESVLADLDQLLNEGLKAADRNNLSRVGESYWQLQMPDDD